MKRIFVSLLLTLIVSHQAMADSSRKFQTSEGQIDLDSLEQSLASKLNSKVSNARVFLTWSDGFRHPAFFNYAFYHISFVLNDKFEMTCHFTMTADDELVCIHTCDATNGLDTTNLHAIIHYAGLGLKRIW